MNVKFRSYSITKHNCHKLFLMSALFVYFGTSETWHICSTFGRKRFIDIYYLFSFISWPQYISVAAAGPIDQNFDGIKKRINGLMPTTVTLSSKTCFQQMERADKSICGCATYTLLPEIAIDFRSLPVEWLCSGCDATRQVR
jgi:hypothetical protein